VDLGHPIALWPIAHREEGADVAGARHFEAGLLLLEHPPQGLWWLHLVPQHPRIHPDVSGCARPDLKHKVTVPDVLLQAHSASLGITFYTGQQFPSEYFGNVFAAEHGSWERTKLTGYKVIRVITKDGVPTGEYEDFATGFVVNDNTVWGRPVGVAVAKDGALLVSEDANGTIWRISNVKSVQR